MADGATLFVAMLARCIRLFSPTVGKLTLSAADVVILGNGPSLKLVEKELQSFREQKTIFAMNHFATSALFHELRPSHYFLLDPVFWRLDVTDFHQRKNSELIGALLKSNWSMTVVCRSDGFKLLTNTLKERPNLKVERLESYWFDFKSERVGQFALQYGFTTPNFVNVAIGALWYAIESGAKAIDLHGMDFSAFRDFYVDQETNNLYSSVQHFYSEEKGETLNPPKYLGMKNKKIHTRLYQTALGFREMFLISKVAEARKISIINRSPSSYLDCFPRGGTMPADFAGKSK